MQWRRGMLVLGCVVLGSAGCATLNSRLYLNEQYTTIEQRQTRDRYEVLAKAMGCTDEFMDAQWKQFRNVPASASDSPCVSLGRFGIPDAIAESDSPAGHQASFTWWVSRTQPYHLLAAYTHASKRWTVVDVSY